MTSIEISRKEFVKRFSMIYPTKGYQEVEAGQCYDILSEELVLLDREACLKVQEHIEKFPSCTKDCPVFEKLKVHPDRALACETARAIDDCPKDKWYAELVRRLK